MSLRLPCFLATLLLGAALFPAPAFAAGKTLQPFASEKAFLAELQRLAKRDEGDGAQAVMSAPPAPAAVPAPATPSPMVGVAAASIAPQDGLDEIQVTGSLIPREETITNVQTLGVDEGDIVKKQGDYLIVLRRGRLFTLRIGSGALAPVDAVNAFAPGSDPSGTWYDEMLVSERTVVVIGYSYGRGGTEIGLFDLGADGRLTYRATYQMRSNDYYSASNYASRLIGRTLVFYTPLEIDLYGGIEPDAFWPGLRHWRLDRTPPEFHRILPATRIYRTGVELDPEEGLALHTVSLCDLDAPEMECRSTAVLGPGGRVFYVSRDAVYVWTTPYDLDHRGANASSVYRIPLDGSAPSGLRASGSPINQMSFLERDGVLNVLVGTEADGEGMWSSYSKAGELALLRLPVAVFGDGTQAANRRRYRRIPGFDTEVAQVTSRYIGDWLLVGGYTWDDAKARAPLLRALRYGAAGPIARIDPGHGIERIDVLGTGAVVVGSHGDGLNFTSIALGQEAVPVDTYVQAGVVQGDERTHGYFYKPTGTEDGIAGLPVLGQNDRGSASAGVLYLRNLALHLRFMGRLDASADDTDDAADGCQVSCVDWYGNARPIFVGDRVFALLGYELVEGSVDGGRIRERRRVDFGQLVKVAR